MPIDRSQRRQDPPWEKFWLPYHIVAWGDCDGWRKWAEPRRLRQHHGDVIIKNGQIERCSKENEELWTGDFIVCQDADWRHCAWPMAESVWLVETPKELNNGNR